MTNEYRQLQLPPIESGQETTQTDEEAPWAAPSGASPGN